MTNSQNKHILKERTSPTRYNRVPYGLSVQEACWLAYRLGELPHTSGLMTTGRDVMRIIHFRWIQLNLPKETLSDFESDILQRDHPFMLSTTDTWNRAMRCLAGDCPMCDTSELY